MQINLHPKLSSKLIAEITATPVLSYSISNNSADVFVSDLQLNARGLHGTVITPWGKAELVSSIVGDFNVSNLLGVITVLCAEGFALSAVVDAVKNLQAPPGRLQRVSVEAINDIDAFVDFAHTPDALDKVLTTLKSQTHHHLWCVFGCGGDRDNSKRGVMGEVVSRIADHCIVTSDNPRSEKPQDIIDQIVISMDQRKTRAIENRKLAIADAVHHAKAGDVILVAGKGHENYQEMNGIKMPFNDADEVRLALLDRVRARSHA